MPNVPCKDCEKRAPGCHGKCAEYKAFRTECDKRIAERKEQGIMSYNPRLAKAARERLNRQKRRH